MLKHSSSNPYAFTEQGIAMLSAVFERLDRVELGRNNNQLLVLNLIYRYFSKIFRMKGFNEMTKNMIENFFKRYERFFAQFLNGEMDANEMDALYAQEFIAASSIGVMAGKNNSEFQQAMAQGYEQYRKIGTKGMRVREVRVSSIDELHCVAHVAWTATYANANSPNIEIDFDVHYLLQELKGKLHIFGWVSGNEQELLKEYGVI